MSPDPNQLIARNQWEIEMLEALKENRVEEVGKLLDMKKSTSGDLTLSAMRRFLTKDRLSQLYNLEGVDPPAIRITSMSAIVRDVCFLQQSATISIITQHQLHDLHHPVDYLPTTTRLNCHSIDNSSTHRSTNNELILLFPQPFNELLIWSVLTKRHSMAKLMWQHGEEALAKALVASKLYQAMALEAKAEGNLTEFEIDSLLCNAVEFDREALCLLNYCYSQDANFSQQLLAREMPNWSNQTCLDLAHACQHRKLLAHSCSQRLLMNLWLGGLAIRMRDSLVVQFCKYDLLRILLALFVFPMIPWIVKFKPNEDIQRLHLIRGQRHQQQRLTYFRKINLFFMAPIVKFDFWSIAYIFFLLVYTYTVLIRTPPELEWNEYYVIAYFTTFGLEKMREILASKMKRKLGIWCTNEWNLCDVLFIVLFFIGVVLRTTENLLDYGRVFYCFNIVYWYIRIVVILRVSIFFGPFITMIGLMLKKLTRYIVLLLVVLMSYGVFRQSLLFPKEQELTWMIIRDIFFKPYFMIYGELFIDDINNKQCDDGTKTKDSSDLLDDEILPCATGSWLNPLMMICYLLVANILVVNLLISVFNSIFQRVEDNSDEIWKINQYDFVMEYKEKPVLPPPFVLFSHLYLLAQWCYCCWNHKTKSMRISGLGTANKEKKSSNFKLSFKPMNHDLESINHLEKIAMERLVDENKYAKSLAKSNALNKREADVQLMDERLQDLNCKLTNLHSLILDQLFLLNQIVAAGESPSPGTRKWEPSVQRRNPLSPPNISSNIQIDI